VRGAKVSRKTFFFSFHFELKENSKQKYISQGTEASNERQKAGRQQNATLRVLTEILFSVFKLQLLLVDLTNVHRRLSRRFHRRFVFHFITNIRSRTTHSQPALKAASQPAGVKKKTKGSGMSARTHAHRPLDPMMVEGEKCASKDRRASQKRQAGSAIIIFHCRSE
jgi:hypothetical protein